MVRPEWGNWTRVVGTFTPSLSEELRDRVRVWNDTWQFSLNPRRGIQWPNALLGEAWIAEGHSLVMAIQDELGPSTRVVGDFMVYVPSA